MNREHEELIAAMIEGYWSACKPSRPNGIYGAIRAAADRGYVLAKLPQRITNLADVPPHVQDETMGTCRAAYRHGWSQCLDSIEIIETEESE